EVSGYDKGDVLTVYIELSTDDVYLGHDAPSGCSIVTSGEYVVLTITGIDDDPNGSYHFEFRATNVDGLYVDKYEILEVVHTITPPTDEPTTTATGTGETTPTAGPSTPSPAEVTTTTTPTSKITPTVSPTPTTEPTSEPTEPSTTPTPTPSSTPVPTPSQTPTPTPTPTPSPTPTPTPTPTPVPKPTKDPLDERKPGESEASETEATEEGKKTNYAALAASNNKNGPSAGSVIWGIAKYLLIILAVLIIARIVILKINGVYNEDLLKEFLPFGKKKKEEEKVEDAPQAVNGYLQKSNTAYIRPMYSNAASEAKRTRGVNHKNDRTTDTPPKEENEEG
nr:hypothetical protein [Clostridiales bacterium]